MCTIKETYEKPIPEKIGYKTLIPTSNGLIGCVSYYPFHLGEADKLDAHSTYYRAYPSPITTMLINEVNYTKQHVGKYSVFDNLHDAIDYGNVDDVFIVVKCNCKTITHTIATSFGNGFLTKEVVSVELAYVSEQAIQSERAMDWVENGLLKLTASK